MKILLQHKFRETQVCLEVGGGRCGLLGSGLWGEVPAGGDGEGVGVHHLDTVLCQLGYTCYHNVIIIINTLMHQYIVLVTYINYNLHSSRTTFI